MGRKMRRFGQELSLSESRRVLADGRYAVWAVSGDDDYPYAVPINYVYDGDSIYVIVPDRGISSMVSFVILNARCA